MRYARADPALKRQAIAQVFPDACSPPPGGSLLLAEPMLGPTPVHLFKSHGLDLL
jgi:hypothetical protein